MNENITIVKKIIKLDQNIQVFMQSYAMIYVPNLILDDFNFLIMSTTKLSIKR